MSTFNEYRALRLAYEDTAVDADINTVDSCLESDFSEEELRRLAKAARFLADRSDQMLERTALARTSELM